MALDHDILDNYGGKHLHCLPDQTQYAADGSLYSRTVSYTHLTLPTT